jgi:hypothetical protein
MGDSLIFSESHYDQNSIESVYEKQLNTHTLRTNSQLGHSLNRLFIGINHIFNSSVIRGNTKNIRDEQRISMIGKYEFSEKFHTGINFKRNEFSDDRSLAINNSSINNLTLFSNYQPNSKIKITPFAGFSDNKQIGENDNGFLYGIEADLKELKTDDFKIDSYGNYAIEDISQRKNESSLFNINVENEFEDNFTNSIQGYFIEQRKDFYFETDSLTKTTFDVTKNVQSRTERNYYISDLIQFRPERSNWKFAFEGKASWRDIDRNTKYKLLDRITSSTFDSKIEEFKLDFTGNVSYQTERSSSFLRVLFSEREERHSAKEIPEANESEFIKRQESEFQKNNKAQQTTVTAGFNYVISNNDFLNLSLFHRKLVYNTPSDFNYDDRDELLSILGINYTRRVSPYFKLFASLEGSLNKIVYIFSERSSNNNIQRTLKLSSGGTYRSSKFSSNNEFEVSANYTAYDFEDLNPNFRSFAYRQFVFKDSTKINLVKDVGISLTAYVKLSEQSDFIWSDFKGKPVRFLEEKFAEPIIEYKYNNSLFGIGLRYFSLSSFKYDQKSERTADTKYTSIGPISNITYTISGTIYIKCTGWYEFINSENDVKRELANLFVDVRWNL